MESNQLRLIFAEYQWTPDSTSSLERSPAEGLRNQSELLQHPHLVHIQPTLHNLAVFDARNGDAAHCNLPFRRGHTLKRAAVRGSPRNARGNCVALDNLIFYRVFLFTECLAEGVNRLQELIPAQRPGQPRMMGKQLRG